VAEREEAADLAGLARPAADNDIACMVAGLEGDRGAERAQLGGYHAAEAIHGRFVGRRGLDLHEPLGERYLRRVALGEIVYA
jgi:hypothetical protein